MSETKTSQVQNAQGVWKKMVDDQVAKTVALHDELAKLEAQRSEQAAQAIEEMGRMARESLSYMGQLSAEWRKLSLEATKRAADMMSFGG